jgi:thioredoxin 1
MKIVTEETFAADVLQSDKPVLVDFWAGWCHPCRDIEPVLNEIASEFGDQVEIVTLDADVNPRVAVDYGVEAVPTLTVFRDGRPLRSLTGVQPKGQIVQLIESALSSHAGVRPD